MGSEDFLIENIKEFIKESRKSTADHSYNSAVTLLFKAIAVISDLFILQQDGFIPKSHTERFRLLESKHPEVYEIMNKVFPIYQQSYRLKLNREYVTLLENELKRLIEITKITI